MNDSVIQPNNVAEAKANKKLAIWIGCLGFGMFVLIYVVFFAVMTIQPGLMFKFFPMPSFTDTVISDGNRIYLLLQKIDMSKFDTTQQNKQPEFKHVMSVLEGAETGASQEIPPYAHVSGANNRLLFLNEGVYRIYDGSRWIEERSAAIGKNPSGILAPAGLYVLSKNESGPHLSLIASGAAIEIPLPAEYLAADKNDQCPCEKLALYQGRLCLFWKEKGSISWTVLNGDTWSPPASSPYSGGYEVISDDKALYLFLREGKGPDRHISYSVFSDNAWSGPLRLRLRGGFTEWDVFIQQGKLKLFVEKFPAQTLYTIEKDALVDPVRLKSPFDPLQMMGMIGRMALLSAISTALFFLVVFGVSAGIRRFKKRIWRENDAEYEFASLFRRFLALMLDNLVLLVPPGIIIAFAMQGMEKAMEGNPLLFMLKIFSATALFLVGGFLYHSLLEGLYGQTLGKKLCGIRVLKADFSRCGLTAGFLRNLLRIADAFFYHIVALVSLAATFKWQRIGDLVADTVVVKEK